jgi:hypothetical protein
MTKSRKGKSAVPRHRGRRSNSWGDPGKGSPGATVSRANMDREERTIERRTRAEGKAAIREGLSELDG